MNQLGGDMEAYTFILHFQMKLISDKILTSFFYFSILVKKKHWVFFAKQLKNGNIFYFAGTVNRTSEFTSLIKNEDFWNRE